MTDTQDNQTQDFAAGVLASLGTSTGARGASVENFDADVRKEGDAAAAENSFQAPDIDPARIRAVFFDLDGTLLPMDLDTFLATYFNALGAFVQERGFDVQAFSKGFSLGMKAMAHHDRALTNGQAFWDAFFTCVDGDRSIWSALIDEFYTSVFARIGDTVIPDPASLRAVETLREKGYPVVLATMPYFPMVAVNTRLAWANVPPEAFERITHYENSRTAKPSTYYYAEQLAACGLQGGDVLMVGNNTVEDLSFAELGASVFLTTNWLLNPNGMDIQTVPHGTMAQFADWAEALPACANPARGIATGLVELAESERVYAASRNRAEE